jgi:DDE superfamily endonuclease
VVLARFRDRGWLSWGLWGAWRLGRRRCGGVGHRPGSGSGWCPSSHDQVVRGGCRRGRRRGYEGEADTITVAFKKPNDGFLTDTQQTFNKAHNGIRAIGERGNALLKMTFRALRNISLNPWRIGDIVAAALTILHINHARTT